MFRIKIDPSMHWEKGQEQSLYNFNSQIQKHLEETHTSMSGHIVPAINASR